MQDSRSVASSTQTPWRVVASPEIRANAAVSTWSGVSPTREFAAAPGVKRTGRLPIAMTRSTLDQPSKVNGQTDEGSNWSFTDATNPPKQLALDFR